MAPGKQKSPRERGQGLDKVPELTLWPTQTYLEVPSTNPLHRYKIDSIKFNHHTYIRFKFILFNFILSTQDMCSGIITVWTLNASRCSHVKTQSCGTLPGRGAVKQWGLVRGRSLGKPTGKWFWVPGSLFLCLCFLAIMRWKAGTTVLLCFNSLLHKPKRHWVSWSQTETSQTMSQTNISILKSTISIILLQ